MKRVLVVEDSSLLLVIYKHFLKSLGAELSASFSNGEEALEYLCSNNVDLIIMDIMLEGDLDGIETVQKIRETNSTPVIFASGNSDPVSLEKIALISNSLFIVKPIEQDELKHALIKILKAS